jgi:hypothetical protein
VLSHNTAIVHPVQLVAAQNEQVIEMMVQKMNEIFSHGISGALVPGRVRKRLLRGQYFHEAAGKMIEFVRLRNVPVHRGRVELCEDIDAAEMRVDAIGDGNIHKTVFSRKRHSGLRAILGKRKQARTLATAHDYAKHIIVAKGSAFCVGHKFVRCLPPYTADLLARQAAMDYSIVSYF